MTDHQQYDVSRDDFQKSLLLIRDYISERFPDSTEVNFIGRVGRTKLTIWVEPT